MFMVVMVIGFTHNTSGHYSDKNSTKNIITALETIGLI